MTAYPLRRGLGGRGLSAGRAPWRARRVASRIAATLGALAVSVLVVALTAAWFAHWKLHIVETGSMGSEVPQNSVAVVSPVNPRSVAVGDVIAFRLRLNGVRPTLHRVVRRVEQDHAVFYETQGDANATPDPRLVPTSDVLGILRFHVPRVGAIARHADGTAAPVVLIGGPAVLAVAGEVRARRARHGQRAARGRRTIVLGLMAGQLEIWEARGPARVGLDEGRIVLGKAPSNDVVLTGDPTVSRIHAEVVRVGAGWAITDLGSRNGTYVNGQRTATTRVLQDGDEIRLGETRVVFLDPDHERDASVTQVAAQAPDLTRREQELLLALCRPVLSGSMLTAPATVKDMAAELYVSESAVKKALGRLYDKFGLFDRDRRTGRLAAEAVRCGAVSLADARPAPREAT